MYSSAGGMGWAIAAVAVAGMHCTAVFAVVCMCEAQKLVRRRSAVRKLTSVRNNDKPHRLNAVGPTVERVAGCEGLLKIAPWVGERYRRRVGMGH